MKILAFAASNSLTSLNKQLVSYAATLFHQLAPGSSIELLDLNDYEMPIYRPDRQAAGMPEQAHTFLRKIGEADALIISFAEHNGSFSAAFKNIYDWASRINMAVYQQKPTVMLATSPGGRGGKGVLDTAVTIAPFFGADIRGSLSIPSFHQNFDVESGTMTNPELLAQLTAVLETLKQ